ncbi:MAG: ABC transporter ATP-binding protein [Bacillota bacterium]|nr:MAG: sodium ABC transporter ATP-binding protein [Bacillota bacterium]
MEPVLEVRDLKKRLGDFEIKGLSFTLERGYIMGFIGPNGAGKTTTIKLIMNLIKKDGGFIKIFGLDNSIEKNSVKIRDRIGVVFGENVFYEELTVREMKEVIAPLYSRWDDGAFEMYLKRFSLPAKRKIKELSKGMKVKLALAIALSHDAELLIMDEPTSGLDPIVRSEFLEILSDFIQDEGRSVFFSTHITSDLDKIADFITFIDEGSLVFSSPKDDLFEEYALVKGPKAVLNPETQKYFVGLKEHQFGIEGLIRNREEFKKKVKDKVVFERPALEDIMFYFTRGKKNV